MYIVVAGNYQQFQEWRYTNCILMQDCVYVTDVKSIRGRHFNDAKIIRYGRYWDRPDIEEIELQLKVCCNG